MARKIIKIFVAIVILISLLLIIPSTGNKIKYYIARNNPGIAAWLSPFNTFSFEAEYTEAMGFKALMTKQEVMVVIKEKYHSSFTINSYGKGIIVEGIGDVHDHWKDNQFYADKKLTKRHFDFLVQLDDWALIHKNITMDLHFEDGILVKIRVGESKFRI